MTWPRFQKVKKDVQTLASTVKQSQPKKVNITSDYKQHLADKIDYYDISDASYYAWQCPNCHSLMVFGEDENPNRYTFYKWIDLDNSEEE